MNFDEIACSCNLGNFFLNDKRYSLFELDLLISNNRIELFFIVNDTLVFAVDPP